MRDEPRAGFYPPPEPRIRALGLGALIGGVLWPFALVAVFVSIAETCGPAGCSFSAVSLLPIAASILLLVVGVVGLELRPRPPLGLLDLIGDLTLGVAAGLFVVAWLFAAPVFLGSAFLLLMVGGVVFGIEGFRHGARPRWPSVLVAIGAGAVLAFAVLGGVGGQGATGGFDQTIVLAILLFSTGWAWLGIDLLLGRPIAIQGDRPEE